MLVYLRGWIALTDLDGSLTEYEHNALLRLGKIKCP